MFVHGAPGIGKSVLVDAVVAATGRSVIRLDARRVEPTPASFLEVSSAAIGHVAVTPDELGDAMQRGDYSLFVIDGYERLRLIDDWIRDHLVPALPASSTTVIVTRTPPNAAWRTGEWRQLANEVEVGPMSEHDATALVEQRIGRGDATEQVLRFGRGHPLALHLAADAVARRPDLTLHDGPPPEVVEELVDVFLDELPASTRTVVQDVSLLRRVTLPTLRHSLCAGTSPDVAVEHVWQTLRELAFVSTGPVGLEIDRVVQDVIAASVELRDPRRARRIRQIAGADRIRRSDPIARLGVHRRPVAPRPEPGHPRCLLAAPRSAVRHRRGPLARPRRGRRPRRLGRWRWLGVLARCVVATEPARVPHAQSGRRQRSRRGHRRTVRPARTRARRSRSRGRNIGLDLEHRPLPAGQRALVVRRVLTTTAGELPSSEYSALIVDLKRYYLELRPALVRVYAVGLDQRLNAAVLEPMGFTPVAADVDVVGQPFSIWSLEFGSRSVDGWLARHIEIETTRSQTPPRGTRLDDALPEGVRHLSAREREVLAALALGLTNRELAERLFISERTANRHLSNIFVKLGVRNRTEATRIAVAAGLA